MLYIVNMLAYLACWYCKHVSLFSMLVL